MAKRKWTPVTSADVEQFRRLHTAGKSGNQIARETGRSHSLVVGYLSGKRTIRPPQPKAKPEDVCRECQALEALYQARRSKQRRCTKHGD